MNPDGRHNVSPTSKPSDLPKVDVRRRDRCSPTDVVQTTECSIQFSPVLVRQEISAVPGVNEMPIDARPIFSGAGVLAIPTLLEKSIGASVVGKAVGSLANTASKSLEFIIGAVAQNETSADQTEPAPRVSFPMRMARASVRLWVSPLRRGSWAYPLPNPPSRFLTYYLFLDVS